jgi:hypothetical protein
MGETRGIAGSGWDTAGTVDEGRTGACRERGNCPPGANRAGQVAVDALIDLARDPDAASASGTFLVFRADGDLESRGPGSEYEKAALRLAADNVGWNEARIALPFAAAMGTCDRGEFVDAAQRRLGLPPAQAEALADLAADLAAQALQMEVVREVDKTLGGIGQRIDRLLASRDEREAVLRELAGKPAEASAALERLGAAGPAGGWNALAAASGARPSDQATLQLALSAAGPRDAAGCGAPSGTWVMQGGTMVQLASPPAHACGAPLVVEDWMDELVRAGLEQGRAAIASAQAALDGALVATSPVNLFRDYGPAVDAVLADLLPGAGTIEGTLLDDGILRAIDDRESTAIAVDTLRAAAKVATAALLGPAYIVAGLGGVRGNEPGPDRCATAARGERRAGDGVRELRGGGGGRRGGRGGLGRHGRGHGDGAGAGRVGRGALPERRGGRGGGGVGGPALIFRLLDVSTSLDPSSDCMPRWSAKGEHGCFVKCCPRLWPASTGRLGRF